MFWKRNLIVYQQTSPITLCWVDRETWERVSKIEAYGIPAFLYVDNDGKAYVHPKPYEWPQTTEPMGRE